MKVSLNRLLAALAVVAIMMGLSASSAGAQDPEAPSIVEVASDDGRFQTLVLALEQTGLADMFADCESGSVYTVLAPTDDAFNAARRGGFNPEAVSDDVEVVASILAYHVLEGAVPAEAVVSLDGSTVATANGEEITVMVEGDTISIVSGAEQAANVVAADVQACNGIIHAIDNVLLPPTVATALGIGVGAEEGENAEGADSEQELANTGTSAGLVTVVGISVIAAGALMAATSRRHRLH